MASSNNNGVAAGSGAIYGLGILGAWFWFWQQADGFWAHLYAIFEGIFGRPNGLPGLPGALSLTFHHRPYTGPTR